MTKERETFQKKVLLGYLKNTKSHPSAEEVYFKIRKKIPKISKGTVYRNLNFFVKKEKIQIIPIKKSYCFDGNISSHAHFICIKCNKIFDIFKFVCKNCKVVKKKEIKVGKIKNYKINFYGICKKCSEKK